MKAEGRDLQKIDTYLLLAKDKGTAAEQLLNCKSVSTDLMTLRSPGGVVYMCQLKEAGPSLLHHLFLPPELKDELLAKPLAFYISGPLNAIAQPKVSSLDFAKDLQQLVTILFNELDASAVHVFQSGGARTRADWLKWCSNNDFESLFESFVTIVKNTELSYQTCGMHCFGLPESQMMLTANPGGNVDGAASAILKEFSIKLMMATASVNDDQPASPFRYESTALGNPLILLTTFAGGDMSVSVDGDFFFNKFGLWTLKFEE